MKECAECFNKARVKCKGCKQYLCPYCFNHGRMHSTMTWWSWIKNLGRYRNV